MPFEDLDTITRHNQPPQATISYAVAQRNGKSKADKKPKLTIAIPTTICGTSKAKAFKLQIGTGAHAGKLRIAGIAAKDKAAGVEPSQHAHFFRWNFGFVPKLGDDQFEGEKRPVIKITDDEFEIDVPESWFEQ
jgi:hypothetical protein